MKQELIHEAFSFLDQAYFELDKDPKLLKIRKDEVMSQINATGTYKHTFEELSIGAKIAWRNSNKCIGRLFWNTMTVLDARNAKTIKEVSEALVHHIKAATNAGKIRPTITIFEPGRVRIWNHQLIRYAGYETEQGVIGDPDSDCFYQSSYEIRMDGEENPT